MPAKESWKQLDADQIQEWRNLTSDYPGQPYYKHLTPQELPSGIPPTLRSKINHAILMASGTPQGEVMLVCDLCRADKDRKGRVIDQQPFALVLDGHGNAPSGMYLHHGDWDKDRTFRPPQSFWDAVDQSGLGRYFYPEIPAGRDSGFLSDLPVSSYGNAFQEMVLRFKDSGYLQR